MIFSRKYRCLFNLVLIYTCLGAFQINNANDLDDSGDVFFSDEMWDNLDADAAPNITRTATNVDALTAFTSAIPINNVVSGNFYLATNPINERTLTSLPNYMIYHSDKLNEEFLFNGYILYNETFKQNFTKKSTNLGSYLNLNTDDLLSKISSGVLDVSSFPSLL